VGSPAASRVVPVESVSWSVNSSCCILASCRCTIMRARSAELARAWGFGCHSSRASAVAAFSEVAIVSRDTSHRWRRLRLRIPPRLVMDP
jgi:hypothetical protein